MNILLPSYVNDYIFESKTHINYKYNKLLEKNENIFTITIHTKYKLKGLNN